MGPKRPQQPYDPKCGPWTSRICIPWELVRNADAQAPAAELDGNMHCNKTPQVVLMALIRDHCLRTTA